MTTRRIEYKTDKKELWDEENTKVGCYIIRNRNYSRMYEYTFNVSVALQRLNMIFTLKSLIKSSLSKKRTFKINVNYIKLSILMKIKINNREKLNYDK